MRGHIRILAAALIIGAPTMASAASSIPAAATTKLAYSIQETDLGTLVDDPASKGVIKKYAPSILDHPQLALARSLTLVQLQRFGGDTLNDEILAKIETALRAVAPK